MEMRIRPGSGMSGTTEHDSSIGAAMEPSEPEIAYILHDSW